VVIIAAIYVAQTFEPTTFQRYAAEFGQLFSGKSGRVIYPDST
jgi:hypothetical protein